MKKFFAVLKHEYKKVVLKWSFLIGTFLIPFLMACFGAVPALIFSLKGEPTRIIVVDPTGKIEPRLKANLSAEKIEERAVKAAADAKKDLSEMQRGAAEARNRAVSRRFRVRALRPGG
jgi:ABC-type Na+ efflux pump permease subunit